MATLTFRIKGTTDDVTDCDQCGRDDLKSTVILEHLDPHDGPTGNLTYMGSDCAARATGWKQTTIRSRAKTADRKAREAAYAAYRAEVKRIDRAWETRYRTWLRDQYGTDDDSLGGPLVRWPHERGALQDSYKATNGDRPVYPPHPAEKTA